MAIVMLCGCDAVNDIDTASTNNVQAENVNVESSTPGVPRKDLEVKVASGVNSNYGLMRVHFIDVGQADSTFIELGNGQTMLIDAGRLGDASTIISYIKNLQYSSIINVLVDEKATNEKLEKSTARLNRILKD